MNLCSRDTGRVKGRMESRTAHNIPRYAKSNTPSCMHVPTHAIYNLLQSSWNTCAALKLSVAGGHCNDLSQVQTSITKGDCVEPFDQKAELVQWPFFQFFISTILCSEHYVLKYIMKLRYMVIQATASLPVEVTRLQLLFQPRHLNRLSYP